MKNVICPICGSMRCIIEFKNIEDIEHKYVKGKFDYYKCKKCKVVFLHPLPSDEQISQFYNPEYQCHTTIDIKARNKTKEFIKKYFGFLFLDNLVFKNISKCFKFILKDKEDVSILEYGCGNCSLMYQIKEKFSLNKNQILGIDLSKSAVKTCKKIGCNAIEGNSLSVVKNKKFDLVLSFQVLEHLSNPKLFLDDVYNLLNNNGILYLQFPNYNSFGRKIFKKYWKGLDVPRHIFLYNKKNIQLLLKDKWEIIDYKTDRFYTSSIKLKKGLKLNEKHWTDKTVWSILLRIHFGRLLGFFGIGDNIHLIIKKK